MQNSDDSDQYDAFDNDPKFEIPPGELDADEKQMGVVDGGSAKNTALKKGKQTWSEEMKDVFKEVTGEQLHTKVDNQHQKNKKDQKVNNFVAEDHLKKVQSKAESFGNKTNAVSEVAKDGLGAA